MLRNKGAELFSEIGNFFTSGEKGILKVLELYQAMKINRFHIGVKDYPQGKHRKIDVLQALLLSLVANTGQHRTHILSDWMKLTLDAEKDVLYRFINDCRVRWRSLVYRINCNLVTCIKIDNPSEACLILDDTDMKKTGLFLEKISRVWSHVEGKAILGFKGLFLCWCDTKSLLALDFSLHREKGKNEKTPFGLKPQHLANQHTKLRPTRSAGFIRAREADEKKTDIGIEMIGRAYKMGISFGYVLMDSWFVSLKMIRIILSLPGKHYLGMGKMNGTKYRCFDKDFTAKELVSLLFRKGKSKRIRSLKMTCVQVMVKLQDIPVMLYFYRNGKMGTWHFLISTNLDLTPLKAYKLYSQRWNIEVFQEAKRYFGLGKCQSLDFDAQIAHTSATMIAFNMFSVTKQINNYETMGDLFREVAGQMTEFSLSERIGSVIEELLQIVAEIMDINFADLIQQVMQSKPDESKLLQIIKYSNADAA